MIKVICNFCKLELNELGGLLFSPPQGTECEKTHTCLKCYNKIFENQDIRKRLKEYIKELKQMNRDIGNYNIACDKSVYDLQKILRGNQ